MAKVLKRPMEVNAGFLVHGNVVGPGRHEIGNIKVRVFNHQVDVEFSLRHLAEGRHERRSHGQIRDEMAVHDIDVNHGCAATFDSMDVVGEVGEIGGQDGRDDLCHEEAKRYTNL